MHKHDNTRFETYRAYDSEGVLLYVGKSASAVARLGKHAYESGWYGEVTRLEIDRHDTYEAATRHEKRLIKDLQPRWNVVYSDDKTVRRNARTRRTESKGTTTAGYSVLHASAATSEMLTDGQARVLQYVLAVDAECGEIDKTQIEIAEAMKISPRAVYKAFSQFRQIGMIEKGRKKHGVQYYKVARAYAVKGKRELHGTAELKKTTLEKAKRHGLTVVTGGKS